MTTLWPPLAQIRADLVRGWTPGSDAKEEPVALHRDLSAPAAEGAPTQALLNELLERRAAALKAFAKESWAVGSIVDAGGGIGVLLDRNDPQTGLWQGWIAAPESDWAGAFDVLLEPNDEPFDPAIGVVQTWNRVSVRNTQSPASVLARLSSARVDAMRAVATESQSSRQPDIEPAPGQIALRETLDGHTVLTGTPHGVNDPRLDYQALYRELGQHLISDAHGHAATPAAPIRKPTAHPSWWERVSRWFRADALVRPAFALLATLVVAQQWALWHGDGEDAVRFRGTDATTAVAPALLVRWQPGTRVEDAQAVLARLPQRHQPTVLADGRWLIEVSDEGAARRMLSGSSLVRSVESP